MWHGLATAGGEPGEYPGRSEMSPAQKVEFLKTSVFELSVDGAPVKFHRTQWYDQKKDMMYVLWWTTFDAGAFSVSWHVFYVYYHSQVDGNLQEMENTVSIEVLL